MMQRSETAQYNALPASPPLQFGRDITARRRWMVPEAMGHPAKLNLHLLEWIMQTYTQPGDWIGDPMAGIGSTLVAAAWQRHVWAMDCEDHWVAIMEANAARIAAHAGLLAGQITIQGGNAREPWDITVDHIICSPPYGCRTSAKPTTREHSLRKRVHNLSMVPHDRRWESLLHATTPQLGALAADSFHYGNHPHQVGHLKGDTYWDAMRDVYTQARTALRPEGLMILVLKDFIAKRQRVHVADRTVDLCRTLGFRLVSRHMRCLTEFTHWTRQRQVRGEPIVEAEDILVFQRQGKE